MDIRCNLEAGVSEGGNGKESHDKPVRAQEGNTKVPSSLEGGQEVG